MEGFRICASCAKSGLGHASVKRPVFCAAWHKFWGVGEDLWWAVGFGCDEGVFREVGFVLNIQKSSNVLKYVVLRNAPLILYI